MEELLGKFREYLTKRKTVYVKKVAEDLELEEYQVYGLVEMLKKQGYLFDVFEGKIVKTKPIIAFF